MFIKNLYLGTVLVIIGIVTGCSSQSESEVIEEVESVVEATFEKDKPKANESGEEYQYKLPFGVNEKSTAQNNVILEKGDQLFTLFYDPKSEKNSHLFEEEKEKDKNPLLLKRLDSNEQTFIKIVSLDNETYELTLGRGGRKITTISTLSKLDNDAELMAEIVYSFEFN